MPSGVILLVGVGIGQHCSWPLNADPLGGIKRGDYDMRRLTKVLGVAGGVAVAGIGWCSYTEPGRMVRSILEIERIPASAHNLECRSPFTTDVLSHCYLEIDPADFEALLTGWSFRESPRSGSSHRAGIAWPGLGDEFEIAIQYAINPPEFEHGGQITVVADASRSRVIVDLYIE